MNFFGHALLAHRRRDEAGFVLGAMLPDLASLCGVAAEPGTAAVADGVAHHHRVDGVFHGCAAFHALVGETVAQLRARAVARGGARGAAHVAVELLLDGALARDEAACRAFRRALTLGAAGAVALPDGEAAARLARVCERLVGSDVPAAYADPAFVAERVCGALSRRPRLALDAAARAAVHATLPDVAARVRAAAPALLEDLEATLRAA